MFKRVITLLLCLLLVFVATFGFVVGVVSVPTIFSYAADDPLPIIPPGGYQQVSSNNQLGEGFLAYCKSRDSEISSSVLGASSTVAYNTLAAFCRSIGFNIADLQSHLWYLNENGQAKWFFDSTGINIYNRAFAYLIQENGLEVGDPADTELYDGDYFVDDDGNSCLVYVIDFSVSGSAASIVNNKSHILKYGSPIKYDYSTLQSLCSVNSYKNLTFNFFGRSYTGNLTSVGGGSNGLGYSCFDNKTFGGGSTPVIIYSSYDRYWAFGAGGSDLYGYTAVLKDSDGYFYIGIIGFNNGWNIYDTNAFNFRGIKINTTPAANSNSNVTNVVVNFTTNNNVINNNTYEGDTIINNDGDVIVYPDNPDQPDPGDPTIPYNPYPDNPNYDPNDPNSPPGTITPPINPSDPNGGDNVNIDFPDFDLDLPEINWSLGDLSQKFPFSIPFDMVSLVRVLDAPAEAPRFQGTVNFGFTTWDYDINLDQFSPVAAVCRIVETLLFVFGLILITRNLIKG